MQTFRSVSVFCTSVALFAATTSLTWAADAALRGTLTSAGAASGLSNICSTSLCVGTIVAAIINIVLGILGVALVGYILYGGFLWMMSGGEEKQIESARAVIKNAVIGIILVGFSYTLSSMVVHLVGETFTSTPPASEPSPSTLNSSTTADPFASGCTQVGCTAACMRQRCTVEAGTTGGAAFETCSRNCIGDCQARCTMGSGEVEMAPSCRSPDGFRLCSEQCAADRRRNGLADSGGPTTLTAGESTGGVSAGTDMSPARIREIQLQEQTCLATCQLGHCAPL